MKKRVLSLFLALTLCLTLLPTAVFADVTENGEGSGGTHYVAESGGTQYETVQEILENTEEGEITLLDSVTEDLTVYAATTIHMNGHSIRLCFCQRREGRREGHAVLRWHGYADLRRSEGGRAG